MRFGGKVQIILFASLVLLAAACGSDDDEATDSGASEEPASAATQNACPSEGCTIDFGSIEAAGDELEITWDMNFDPDLNNNHIHIYWDIYEPEQVSDNAADNGLVQGEWVPTDLSPTYTTDGPASTSMRGDSTTLCVVSADRDHNVIDASSEVCRDVSEYLS